MIAVANENQKSKKKNQQNWLREMGRGGNHVWEKRKS